MKSFTLFAFGLTLSAFSFAALADTTAKSTPCSVEFQFAVRDGKSTTDLGTNQDKEISVKMPPGFGKWKCFRQAVKFVPEVNLAVGSMYCTNDALDSYITIFAGCRTDEASEDVGTMTLKTKAGNLTLWVSCEGKTPTETSSGKPNKLKEGAFPSGDAGTDAKPVEPPPTQSHELTPTISL